MMLMSLSKVNVVPAMAIRTVALLYMVAMIIGCSTGRDDTARTMAQEEKAAGEIQLHDCKPEEMQALMKQAHKEAGSEGSRMLERGASGTVSAGLSWIPVIGPVLAGANDVRQDTKEWL